MHLQGHFPLQPTLEDRTQAILAAGLLAWSTRSCRAVPLRQIAQNSGVSLALIHHHFGGKAGLFAALLAPMAQAAEAAEADEASPGADGPGSRQGAAALALLRCHQALHSTPLGPWCVRLFLLHCQDLTSELCLPLCAALAPLHRRLQSLCAPTQRQADPMAMWPALCASVGVCAVVQAPPLSQVLAEGPGAASLLGLIEQVISCRMVALQGLAAP